VKVPGLATTFGLPKGTVLLVEKVHPDIHPDDLARAISARIKQRRKERTKRRTTVQEIIEDFLIASLANTPVEEWTADMWTSVSDCTIKDKQFLVRLGRAIENPDRQFVDRIDVFILANWRRGLTLRDKKPSEAVALIRRAKVASIPSDAIKAARWYVSRRKRLGLAGHS
jgi:hypothetical protein